MDDSQAVAAPADPPAEMLRILYGSVLTQLLSISAELRLADLLADGPRSSHELANETAAHPEALYRMLRTLASYGVFTEVSSGTFALTPLAETLRSDVEGSMRDAARSLGMRARQHAFAELDYSVRTGKPSFDHAHGTDWWSYLATHPEQGSIFNNHMGNVARQIHAAAVEAYDLSGVSRLIDVGGGHGHLVSTILRHHSEMRAVVFDAPHVIAETGAVLDKAGVGDRAETVGGDFFASVPAGGDAYTLSWILHDWNDEDARTLLGNIRRAIDPAGRLLVIDAVIPEGNEPHLGKLFDITMLALLHGRERTETEFSELFEASGFRHTQTLALGATTSLLIAHPNEAT